MQFLVDFLVLVVIGIPLGVGQYGRKALELQVEDQLLDIPERLQKRVLDEQVVARHGHHLVALQDGQKIVVHAVLGRVAQLYAQLAELGLAAQPVVGVAHGLRRVLEGGFGHVRGGDYLFDAPFAHLAQQGQRVLGVGRTVVDTRQYMAVNLCCIGE